MTMGRGRRVGRKEKGPNVWSRERSWFGLQASPQKTFCCEVVEGGRGLSMRDDRKEEERLKK